MLTNILAHSEGFLRLPRALGKTASLFLWYYKHILRYLSLELPTAILPLERRKKNEATEKQADPRGEEKESY